MNASTAAPSLIVCGVRCVWWDSIDKTARTPDRGDGIRIPCCPHCGSVLYQFEPERWWQNVDGHEAKSEPGYRAFIEWLRGKCFPSLTAAKAAYEARPANVWAKIDSSHYRRDDGAEVIRSGFGVARPWVGQGPGKNEYVRARLYADSEVKGGASTFKTAENAMRAVDKTFRRAAAEARANG